MKAASVISRSTSVFVSRLLLCGGEKRASSLKQRKPEQILQGKGQGVDIEMRNPFNLGNRVMMQRTGISGHIGAKQSLRGSGMAEYGLCGIILLLMCVVGFQTLGTGLNATLQDLKKDLASPAEAAQRQEAAASAAAQHPVGKQPAVEPIPDVSSWPSADALSTTVSTSGANGATEMLANALQLNIAQWEKDGKLTPEQVNLLIELASRGHEIALAQKIMIEAHRQGQSTVTYKGTKYSLIDLSETFSYYNVELKDVWALNPELAKENIKPFAQVYHRALASLGGTQSDIGQVVSNMGIEISTLANVVSWSFLENPSVEESQQRTASLFRQDIERAPLTKPASTSTDNLTHKNSGEICTSGSGKDNGTACSAR
jgi:hypothetical protein